MVNPISIVLTVLMYICYAIGVYLSLAWLAAFPTVLQERKIWQSRGVPNISLFGMVKVYALNVVWMSGCSLGSLYAVTYCLFLAMLGTPMTTVKAECRRLSHTVVERGVAKLVCRMFLGPVQVKGAEHLPKPPSDPKNLPVPAPIFIANHASQLDVALVYFLDQPWRWIAKSSVVFLPGVGQLMFLADHVFIDRAPKKKAPSSATPATSKPPASKGSARNLYIQSNASIQEGVAMFFFPQGTRRMVERLPFKDGAFKVAIQNESSMIPISLDIPTSAWNSMYPFSTKGVQPVVVTIHPPVKVKKDEDIEKLKKQTFDTIYGALPDFQKDQ